MARINSTVRVRHIPGARCRCQCEHISHVNERGPHDHEYFADVRTLQPVQTPFGIFHICNECADTCYAEYTKRPLEVR